MAGRRLRVNRAAAALLLVAVGGTACSSRFGALEPATRQGEDVLDLWRVLFYAALGLGLLVLGLIFWSLIRYRRRSGPDGEGRQQAAAFSENVPLELFYTAVPLVIVAVLFGVTMVKQRSVNRLAPEPDLRIEVTGFQWGWRFQYLTENITVLGTQDEPPTMVLPVGTTARLLLLSPDVLHSFYVPEFLNKRDVVPGVENRVDVTPSRLGRFGGVCAEFCGLDHARMTFVVEVVEPEEFQQFVVQQQEEERTGATPPGQQGGSGDPGGQAAPPGRLPDGLRGPNAMDGVTVG